MSVAEDALRLLRERRSVRRFREDPIEREVLERIVEVAAWAPSAGNRQDWEFTVVTSPDLKRRMAEAVRDRWKEIVRENAASSVAEALEGYAHNFDWFAGAPAVVVVTARAAEAFLKHLFGERAASISGAGTSAAMAAQNMMLAAHALGVGSTCLTGPLAAEEKLIRMLGLGKRHELVCLVALGYPAETPEAPPRKSLDRIMRTME